MGPWGTLGSPGVPWGNPGYPGVPWGTLGYPGLLWGTPGLIIKFVRMFGALAMASVADYQICSYVFKFCLLFQK